MSRPWKEIRSCPAQVWINRKIAAVKGREDITNIRAGLARILYHGNQAGGCHSNAARGEAKATSFRLFIRQGINQQFRKTPTGG